MGRLWEPERVTNPPTWRDYWDEFLNLDQGFTILQWKQPSPAELGASIERQQRIFEGSNVPWIVSDLGALAQFYDDAQDVISLSRWTRRAVLPTKAEKAAETAYQERRQVKDWYQKGCAAGKVRGKKRQLPPVPGRRALNGEILIPMLLRLFPGTAPLAWGMLAGQVLHMLTGYGISLGGVVGAALEAGFRGAENVGLPFDKSHNKFHQLKVARTLQGAPKGIAAGIHLPFEDRFTAIMAYRLAVQDALTFERVDIDPADYPQWSDLVSDPIGLFKSLYTLQDSMFGNAANYLTEDLLPQVLSDLGALLKGQPTPDRGQCTAEGCAARNRLHCAKCLPSTVCGEGWMDAYLVEAWATSKNLFRDRIGNVHAFADDWLGTTILDPDVLGSVGPGESSPVA